MGIDFNNAPEQGAAGVAAIPEDSVVMVVASIREPQASRKGAAHPLFTKSETSPYEFLDFEFVVASKAFEGKKIWQNFMLHFNAAPTDNSKQAINISMRTLRAIVEAARNIHPKDATPTATAKRVINDFSDINGMLFPVLVGVEWSKPKDGKRYLNNTIKRIVTPDDERYEKVRQSPDQAIISDKPLPAEPAAAPAAAAAPWSTPKAEVPAAQQTGFPSFAGGAKPAWAK